MQLSHSVRKLVALGISGSVVLAGGAAFAEDLVNGTDPVVVPDEGTEAVVTDPTTDPVVDPLADPVQDPAADPEADPDADLVTTPEADPAGDEDATADDAAETLADDTLALEEDVVEETHPDNHGAAVSEAAHTATPEGYRNHGEWVSSVARDNHGHNKGGDDATTETEGADDDAAETEVADDDAAADDADDSTTDDSVTATEVTGHGKGHGKNK